MSGSSQRRRVLYGIDTRDTSGGKRTSARRRAMTASSWARNTASPSEPRTEILLSYIHWYLDFLRWRPAAVSLKRSSNILRSLKVAWSAFGYTIDLPDISSAFLPFCLLEQGARDADSSPRG